jgi:hypothetical protein
VVGVVGDDERDLALQLAAAPAPQQVEQAVVLARHEHGDPLRPRGVGEPPVHPEALADLGSEGVREVGVERREREGHAHEERAALGVGRVLVGAHDVRVAGREEARDRGNDAVPVRARDEQPRLHGPANTTRATPRRPDPSAGSPDARRWVARWPAHAPAATLAP